METQTIEPQLLLVAHAGTADALLKALVRSAGMLEFENVSMTLIFDCAGGKTKLVGVDNAPAAYMERFDDPDAGQHDPVSQHCKRRPDPIVWDQSTYVRANKAELGEYQSRFGYRTGIAMALHLPLGRHLFIGVDRDKALRTDSNELTQDVAALTLFAVMAQKPAFDILSPDAAAMAGMVPLSARELEALRWAMEGKTAWEVGRILAISEQATAGHLNNATHKLGCASKHQAVVKALRLGLIR